MIQSMEGFTFATKLDLNMANSYYHIKLDADADAGAQKLCTIVFPWGEYRYKCLPMGIKISAFPDVFQNVMSKLSLTQDMECTKTYLDDLLILSNNNFKDHLLKLQMVLARLTYWYESQCIQITVLCRTNRVSGHRLLDYQTRIHIQPVHSKVEVILNIKAPKTRKELRQFMSMV
jgi:hypothetical protein